MKDTQDQVAVIQQTDGNKTKLALKAKNTQNRRKKSTGLKDLKDMKMIKPSWPKRQ